MRSQRVGQRALRAGPERTDGGTGDRTGEAAEIVDLALQVLLGDALVDLSAMLDGGVEPLHLEHTEILGMIERMKIKTSITIEDDLLRRIDEVLLERESRSAFFEDAAEQLAERRERARRDDRDRGILNARAAELNEEAEDDLALVSEVFRDLGVEQP